MDKPEYVRHVLEAYCATPHTAGVVRRPDRLLAAQWFARGVPLTAVKNAMVLTAVRRLVRAPEAPRLGTIRSLAYFAPALEEVLHLNIGQDYFQYLRGRLKRIGVSTQAY